MVKNLHRFIEPLFPNLIIQVSFISTLIIVYNCYLLVIVSMYRRNSYWTIFLHP